jgi:hypothetical protein
MRVERVFDLFFIVSWQEITNVKASILKKIFGQRSFLTSADRAAANR